MPRVALHLGATCPRDLGCIEPVLPRFSDPQLEQLRTMMVTTSVDDVLAQYKAHGATPYEAAMEHDEPL